MARLKYQCRDPNHYRCHALENRTSLNRVVAPGVTGDLFTRVKLTGRQAARGVSALSAVKFSRVGPDPPYKGLSTQNDKLFTRFPAKGRRLG